MALVNSILKDSFAIKDRLWESNYRNLVNEILSSLNPVTDRIITSHVEQFVKSVSGLIIEKRDGIKSDILEKITETNYIIDKTDVKNIKNEVDIIFESDRYIGRIDDFIDSAARAFQRYGINLNYDDHRFDLQIALYKTMVINLLNEAKLDIKNLLEVLLLKTMTIGDTKFDQIINYIKNSKVIYFVVFIVTLITVSEYFNKLKDIVIPLLPK